MDHSRDYIEDVHLDTIVPSLGWCGINVHLDKVNNVRLLWRKAISGSRNVNSSSS